MEGFVKGEVVIIDFPFSDLSNTKKRPALVIKPVGGDDVILCQITANQYNDYNTVLITTNNLESGYLRDTSYVRISRLFTADGNKIIRSVGKLESTKLKEVIKKLIDFIQS